MIRALPIRAFLLWFALHAFVAGVSGAETVVFTIPMSVTLIGTAALLGFLDTRRRHEFTLLGNLGIPTYTPSAMWGGTVLLLEAAIRAGFSLAR